MELNKQVTSLELSKKLKELNVKQDSLFYWSKELNGYESSKELCIKYGKKHDYFEVLYSAFSVAELGEMLPKWTSSFRENENKWACDLSIVREKPTVPIGDTKLFEAETEADARAKMVIWLIENKYLTFTKQGL